MKKYLLSLLLGLCIVLCACGKEEEEVRQPDKLANNEIYLYYINETRTDMWPVPFKVNQEEKLSDISEKMIDGLRDTGGDDTIASAIFDGVEYRKCKRGKRKGNIELYFDISYDTLTPEDILFFKSCVVKSFLGLNEFRTVTLFFTDVNNQDEETATISEKFDQDSFSLVFGEGSGYQQKGVITVYFASESGKSLKEYRKSVEITNTTSLPRLVIETLIDGPSEAEYSRTIPEETTLQSVSVKDGICYVDLSDEFYSVDNPLKNDVIVYSIVNSLVELPTVTKVQFLRNGEKQEFFRETLPFDGIFERNLDLIGDENVKKAEADKKKAEEKDAEEEQKSKADKTDTAKKDKAKSNKNKKNNKDADKAKEQ